MIKVVARTLVREECIEAYQALAKEIVAASQNDRGVITYTMNQSTGDKRLHAMIEAWEDMESLQAHMASEHFRRIVPQMAQYADTAHTGVEYRNIRFAHRPPPFYRVI